MWPGELVERTLLGKGQDEPADVGKVLGAFLSSGVVHSLAGYTVVPERLPNALGEFWFFVENGFAVIIEEGIKRLVLALRSRKAPRSNHQSGNMSDQHLERWYDDLVARIWWTSVLLYTGRNFARGER